MKKRDLGRKNLWEVSMPLFSSETWKAWFHIHVEQGNKSWMERKRPAITTDSCLLQKPNPRYPHVLFSRNSRLSYLLFRSGMRKWVAGPWSFFHTSSRLLPSATLPALRPRSGGTCWPQFPSSCPSLLVTGHWVPASQIAYVSSILQPYFCPSFNRLTQSEKKRILNTGLLCQ